ncbi:TonB family protein [Halothiobacillus neapolitanus]|uniref:Protein TonB n=1 Tax=Halothiobacillus neapolitanus (strain ATCC 23641 / DSM 15147 / CIP 104769 / NCIMB 8539 / c2) TaxID=555778 RepID=D0KW72_HALNC|nr:energy transducer TonB [Halothiobacillus neapolitanus]ACX96975.1 TonB family protein [Halothiobacillus neapolitanus c2]TDN59806.1 outer membrane transport energization protein TonB [Halothiobacillus neapolitanus]
MSPSRTGFVISALLHAALVGVGLYFWLKPTPQTDGSKEVVVPVSLASFAPATAKPRPQPTEPAQKPIDKPEPEEDEPLNPSPGAKPEAEQIQKPELKPEPKPKPEQKNVAKSVSTPKPKQTHQSAPPKPPAPKVHKTPAAPHPTASAPRMQPSTEQQPERQAESAPPQNPAPDGTTPDELDQIRLQYQSALAEAIEREKFYPSLARRLNQQGLIRVGFTVLADGRITNIHLVEPSAATALNQGAIEAIKRVGQFKPIPPALGIQSMDLNISLIYKLR